MPVFHGLLPTADRRICLIRLAQVVISLDCRCRTLAGKPPLDIDFLELAEFSPNPYVLMDRDLRLVWMNRAYLAVTMRAQDEIVGRTMFEAFPSDPESESFRLLDQSLRNVLETGEVDEIAVIRYDIARPDGSMEVRYWSATHTPLKDADGRLRFILQHTVDVTELRRLRQLRDEFPEVRHVAQRAIRSLDRGIVAAGGRL